MLVVVIQLSFDICLCFLPSMFTCFIHLLFSLNLLELLNEWMYEQINNLLTEQFKRWWQHISTQSARGHVVTLQSNWLTDRSSSIKETSTVLMAVSLRSHCSVDSAFTGLHQRSQVRSDQVETFKKRPVSSSNSGTVAVLVTVTPSQCLYCVHLPCDLHTLELSGENIPARGWAAKPPVHTLFGNDLWSCKTK